MASTTRVVVFHGSSPTTSIITNTHIRFKRADDDTVNTANPIPIPTNSINYSWRKHTKLEFVTAPPEEITNLRWLSDGTTVGTGVQLVVTRTNTYVQGSVSDETAQVTGDDTTVDATTYTTSSPLVVNAGTVVTSTDTFPRLGNQKFVAQQMKVFTTALAGSTSARTYVCRYDES